MSSFLFSGHYFLHSSLQSDFGCVELSQSRGRCEVWMNGFGLFGFSGTFSSLLYCRLTVCWIYCIFFFVLFCFWGRGDICYNIVMIIWTVNCTEFTIVVRFLLGIHIKSYSLIIFSFFCFFFFPLTVENQIVQLQSLSCSLGIVCFYFLEPMIKRNLKTVNKYYCAEIWMSLQKCIWMS